MAKRNTAELAGWRSNWTRIRGSRDEEASGQGKNKDIFFLVVAFKENPLQKEGTNMGVSCLFHCSPFFGFEKETPKDNRGRPLKTPIPTCCATPDVYPHPAFRKSGHSSVRNGAVSNCWSTWWAALAPLTTAACTLPACFRINLWCLNLAPPLD